MACSLLTSIISESGPRRKGSADYRSTLQALTNRMHEIANGEKEAKCEREKTEKERKTYSAEKKKGGNNVTRTKCEVVGFFVCAFWTPECEPQRRGASPIIGVESGASKFVLEG